MDEPIGILEDVVDRINLGVMKVFRFASNVKRLCPFRIPFPRKDKQAIRDRKWGCQGLTLLNSPPEVHASIVFVHGLRGGSYKTWSNGKDLESFWPQAWLAQEPKFRNVRIYTYGYHCDWTIGDLSILNIHDFGNSLYQDLSLLTSSDKENSETPLILVGHSMGGLVSKKALLIAHEKEDMKVAGRICAFTFLASPHRGSDSAQLLTNVLRATGKLQPLYTSYIAELQRNSPSLQAINDEFKIYSVSLHLQSFYETRPMKIGFVKELIVAPESAKLGYPNEIAEPLDADHRQAARFDSPEDPNYKRVRNSLGGMVQCVVAERLTRSNTARDAGMRGLEPYLKSPGPYLGHLSTREDTIEEEYCHWFDKRKDFQDWFANDTGEEFAYAVVARRGTGKSVLAAYLSRRLQARGLNYIYYSFQRDNTEDKCSASFFRSFVYQLAFINPRFRRSCIQQMLVDVRFDSTIAFSIYRALFSVLPLERDEQVLQHYVVIDAIDDCRDASFLLQLLGEVGTKFRIRVIVTSRKLLCIYKYEHTRKAKVVYGTISRNDLLLEVRLVINKNLQSLPSLDTHRKQAIADKIATKSEGSFWWVRLILQEIKYASNTNVLGDDEIDAILCQTPAEMKRYHLTTLEMTASLAPEKDVYDCILSWATCAIRPLKFVEILAAVYCDIQKTMCQEHPLIEMLYGDLLYVTEDYTVEIAHFTVRETIFNVEESESAIDPCAANRRIAIICLKYLTTDDILAPRHKGQIQTLRRRLNSDLTEYASTAFSEHLVHASAVDFKVLLLLVKFLETDVLTWMDYILKNHSVTDLMRTGNNIRRYVEMYQEKSSSLRAKWDIVYGWAMDLIRLGAKFQRQLQVRGAYKIARFCPPTSMIYQHFGETNECMPVEIDPDANWEDWVSLVEYQENWPISVACGDKVFALGMESGDIHLYNLSTCHDTGTLHHREPVNVLKFYPGDSLLVSAGTEHLRLWKLDHSQVWSYNLPGFCVKVSFSRDPETVLATMREKHDVQLSLKDGSEIKRRRCTPLW